MWAIFTRHACSSQNGFRRVGGDQGPRIPEGAQRQLRQQEGESGCKSQVPLTSSTSTGRQVEWPPGRCWRNKQGKTCLHDSPLLWLLALPSFLSTPSWFSQRVFKPLSPNCQGGCICHSGLFRSAFSSLVWQLMSPHLIRFLQSPIIRALQCFWIGHL